MIKENRFVLFLISALLLAAAVCARLLYKPQSFPVVMARASMQEAQPAEEAIGITAGAREAGPVDEELPEEQEEAATRYVTFPLDLNAATMEELQCIPKVGEVMSSRIVQYREVLGGYTDLAQLQEIKGVGASTFELLSAYLYVGDEE